MLGKAFEHVGLMEGVLNTMTMQKCAADMGLIFGFLV